MNDVVEPTPAPDGSEPSEAPGIPAVGSGEPQGVAPKSVDTPVETDQDGDSEFPDGELPTHLAERASVVDEMNDKLDKVREDEIAEYRQSMEEGVTGAEPIEAPDEDPEDAPLPEEVADDPLADFLVQDEETGEVFFRTKVDGQEVLVDLDKARTTLQKHEAADARLQNGSELLKDLQRREEQLQQNEAALSQKAKDLAAARLPSPPVVDVDDQDLDGEVREVVGDLFAGTQDEAAEKLTALLRKTRAPVVPQVDPDAVARHAVSEARRQTQNDAEALGFATFRDENKDIVADPKLFAWADASTDEIAAENPDWSPTQVMREAGKRTREQFNMNSETPPAPNDDRLKRKRKLRPLPLTSRSSERRQPDEVDPVETPSNVMAEIRESRGQAN